MLKLVSRRFSNYYETLGVSIDSSNLQIKTAYYKLARKYHPDLMPNKDSTKFKEINEAYATLIDPSRKENYDKEIASGNTKTSATPDDTSEYQSKYSENKGENFKMNESNYHKFWENVQKHGNKNINEERRKEYLRKHREKLDTKEGSQ